LVERKPEIMEYLRASSAGTGPPLTPILPVSRQGELGLSFAQQRLWFLDQYEGTSPLYNISASLRLAGKLDRAAMERAVDRIVHRHEVLRTSFITREGKPSLRIAQEFQWSIPLVDLTYLSEDIRQEEALRMASAEVRRTFDLGQAPLMRMLLLRLRPEEHVLVMTMHHIISDGWSVGLLMRELASLYSAYTRGPGPSLSETAVQYVDFAHWQRERLKGEALETQLASWRSRLSGSPPLLELPLDRPRPPVQTSSGALHPFSLPPELTRSLHSFGRQESATLFMTLVTAFNALLHRYTGQEDICIGTPVANRNRPETEGLLGLFVNTLVLRTDLTGEPHFRGLLQRVREASVSGLAVQDLPFEMLVEAIQPRRSLSYSPLFQVMFVLQEDPTPLVELPGIECTWSQIDSGTAKFDLTLFATDTREGLKGVFEYNTDLFDGHTIARMAEDYQAVLRSMVESPNSSISHIPLLRGAEQEMVLSQWNGTCTDDPPAECIHHLIERQAARTPDAAAMVFEDEWLTYRELDGRTARLARYLAGLGVGPEERVGVCMNRSIEMVVALLGILKAGAAYVPLDPAYPAERLRMMIEDSGVQVILTQELLREKLSGVSFPLSVVDDELPPTSNPQPPTILFIDTDRPKIARESDANLGVEVDPSNLAYVLFTSGSTGRPKGIAIEHRSVAALLHWVHRVYPVEEMSGTLASTSISWDLSVFELFATLSAGGTIVLAENALQLPLLPAADRVTLINTVPSAITELLRSKGIPASVQTVNLAGEPLPGRLVDQLYSLPHILRVFDLYGPGEDTTYSTFTLRRAGGQETIGRPIANSKTYLLDPCRTPVPIGVSGELYISGHGLARGYFGKPDLTARSFLPDPFSEAPGGRLYKTGDLARYLPDGNIQFLGRIDHQVKVRGFRIELGEIQSALSRHPDLREAVVMAREDTPGRKHLVAYVVPERMPGPSAGGLRAFLKGILPDYMVPSFFVELENLPMTPNGKVDRRALPAVDFTRAESGSNHVGPRTRAEGILADIWCEVLGLEKVGIFSDFFELGGDSILGIQVVAKANSAGLRLIPRQIFEAPTIAGLAAVAGTGPTIQADQSIVTGAAPLTPIQCWFFEQDLPDPDHWNQSVLLELTGSLDPGVLEAALELLLQHHDALRLRFSPPSSPPGSGPGTGEWLQVNEGMEGGLPLVGIDLSELQDAEKAKAMETCLGEIQAGLDLREGPILRMARFDLGPEKNGRLLIVIHHLAVDGVSWRILLEDLQAACLQAGRGGKVRLPSKTTAFRDWALQLMEHAQKEAVRGESSYWLSVCRSGAHPLPADFPSGDNTEASEDRLRLSLSSEETRALLQDVREVYGAEVNEVLLAALARALIRWTGGDAVLVELEGHGREEVMEGVDVSRTVGWFTSIFPVLLSLRPGEGVVETLKRIKEQLRRVPAKGIGFGILRYLGRDREGLAPRTWPRAQVSFNYLGQFDQVLSGNGFFRLCDEFRGPERNPLGARTHWLSIDGGVLGGRLHLDWRYSGNLHRQDTIRSVSEEFTEGLREIIALCRRADKRVYTPSDFPDIELTQNEVDALTMEILEGAASDPAPEGSALIRPRSG
jgi:amino acid adenylation domain-containing protein/non-ribosomal peptide synthase protein (TIGR01720 family)